MPTPMCISYLQSEAGVCRRVVLLFPANPTVYLHILKLNKAHQILWCLKQGQNKNCLKAVLGKLIIIIITGNLESTFGNSKCFTT